jgi:HSP20 family protein
MGTLKQVKEGMSRAWDSLREGWTSLTERASHALTHYSSDDQSRQKELRLPEWGLLTAELREHDDRYEVSLEVPGMGEDQFNIMVVDNTLVVSGEKLFSHEGTEGRFHVMERAYGSFERAIPLPAAVDDSKAKASYKRGVLTVTLPKQASQAYRRIQVKTA